MRATPSSAADVGARGPAMGSVIASVLARLPEQDFGRLELQAVAVEGCSLGS